VKFILLLVLGLLLAYWILRGYRRGVGGRATGAAVPGGEDMLRCEHCGVHLPRSEGVLTRGRFYCTPDHQQAHDRS
jgi:uncharacterized protein